MGRPGEPKPVKLFVALLSRHEDHFPLVEKELTALFGPTDSACGSLPWAVTDYYEKEMGTGLFRRFVSFVPLISPEALAEIKLKTQGVEEGYQWIEGEKRGRRVNIDPGYLDAGKVVLASTKSASHRIYLRSGIYGEVTLLFQSGSFQPLAYTYPDYLWPETRSFFMALRSLYLRQLKQDD
ncbi:DUF4416 family protein [bacterium]|nr:MAG: DUF4416 family protein [bacterium]